MRWSVILVCLCANAASAQSGSGDLLRGLLGAQEPPRAAETAQERAIRLEAEAAFVTEVQTWLAYYGFYKGPLDGIAGPGTQRALDAALDYVHRPGMTVDAMHRPFAAESLGFLARSFASRDAVVPGDLDARDAARLAEAGPRFWLRKALGPPADRRGVRTPQARDTCGAWANAGLLDTQIDPRGVLDLPGAEFVRVTGRGPITMDMRPTRLNVEIDHWDTVVALSCN